MNHIKLILSCIVAGLLLSLTGCGKRSNYKSRQLLSLKESAHVDYQETKELVTVRAKAFTKNDCDYIFGERTDRIISHKDPLQPIQLCIENNSSSAVKLVESTIDLTLTSSREVTQRLSSSSKYLASGICGGIGLCGITIGIITAAIAAATVTCPCCFLAPLLLIGVGGIVTISSPFAFLIENWNTGAENSKISSYIHEKNVGKEIVIKPGKMIDVLIFVKKNNYQQTFKCNLIDGKSGKEITFKIKLDQLIDSGIARHTDSQERLT